MIIDGFTIAIEHTKDSSFFTVRGVPFGIQARLTVEQLEALAQELTREGSTWRRRIAENHYTVLGVPQTATPEEIQKAYRTMQKRFHPDSKGGSTERSQTINAAYETLSVPERRNVYDRTL
jgi:DnaJ-domain-containing protein 1